MHQKEKVGVSTTTRNGGVARIGLMAVAALLMLEPSVAAAAPWDEAVRSIVETLQGNLGRGIAIIAVIALGIMAMAGRLEWATAIKVVLGIVIMFSAGQIINWISPTAGVSAIAATSQADCNARGYVWVPESLAVVDTKGVVIEAQPPRCVEKASAMAACTSTISGQNAPAAEVAGSRATPIYYQYVTNALTCSAAAAPK